MTTHPKNPAGAKVQGYVPQYHKFVIASLIGIEGTNESDVLARIIGYWVRDNERWLAERQITHEQWSSECSDPEAKEGKLYRYAGNVERRVK
jgi:hypothetical protein